MKARRISMALFILASSSPVLAAFVCQPSVFVTPTDFPAGLDDKAIVQADFNGDGHIDVAVAGNGGVAVLLGNGDGTFQGPVLLLPTGPFSYQYTEIAAADLTGNGIMSLIAMGTPSLTILLGNGDGTFQDPLNYSFIGESITVGDFTGDGLPDIVAAAKNVNEIEVFTNNGDGSMTPQTPIPVSFIPGAIASSDLDRDGALDLVLGDRANPFVSTLRGDGHGRFAPPVTYPSCFQPYRVRTADLDGDGYPDVVVADLCGVSVFLNAGSGSLVLASSTPLVFSSFVSELLLTDLDGDGYPDIEIVGEGGLGDPPPTFAFFKGVGDGHFLDPQLYFLRGDLIRAVTGDFNEDATEDVVFASQNANLVSFIAGLGGGELGAPLAYGSSGTTSIAVADFDGDGLDDVLSAASSGLVLRHGIAGKRLGPPTQIGAAVDEMAVGDFDGDGWPDIAFVPQGTVDLTIVFNDRSGGFLAPLTIASVPGDAESLLTGDLNEDGAADLVRYGQGIQLFLSDGSGGLGSTVTLDADTLFVALAISDINQDGHQDLVGVDSSRHLVAFLGGGDGSFSDPIVSDFTINGTGPVQLTAAKIDSDDFPDLALAYAANEISVSKGNGDGTFANPTVVASPGAVGSVAAADFDSDGYTDLVGLGDGTIFFPGNGNLTFGAPNSSPGFFWRSFVTQDLVHGGNPDILVGGDYDVAIFRNSRLSVSAPHVDSPCDGSEMTISADAAGRGIVSYQWRRDGIPLTDSLTTFGSNSPTLRVAPASGADSGNYDVVVADRCAGLTSTSASVSVSQAPVAPVVTAPLTVLPDATGLLASVEPVPFHRYLWAISAGSIDAGQRFSQISWSAPGPGITVRIYAADLAPDGCLSDNGVTSVQTDFLDVPPSNEFHDYIDALALHGVTLGCGNGDYCPDQSLPRDQMAAFIARAAVGTPQPTGMVKGIRYDCEPFGSSYFADVSPTDPFCAAIHYLAAQGITIGCDSTPDFCPGDLVTREQMALFIGRAIAPSATPPSAYSDGGTGRSYDCSVSSPFTDVPSGTPTCNAVGYIWAKGIIDGFGDGTYHPSDVLTRAPAAKFIANAFGLTLGP